MKTPARRLLAAFAFGATMLSTTAGFGAFGSVAQAQGIFEQPKYAAIVVDAKTGEVLYSRHADAPRVPASVTKVMTLYMTFEAMANGRLSPNDRVPISQHAANQAPSKLGLRPGETISLDDAIRAAAVKSANDIAVALAERVGGTEDRFAQMMTTRAQELGMRNTRFINANGLPDRRGNNITTARDLAILSRAVMRDYPQYYGYFSQRNFVWNGRNNANHNHLMSKMPGVDGIKTGYTVAAGFNLAASAVRDGRRLITVVLGGPSTAARDNNVETLLTAGFDVLNRRARGQNITIAANLGVTDDSGASYARPAVQPGEPRAVMVAEAPREFARPVQALQQAPVLAVAAMAPIADPTPTPKAALPEVVYTLAEAAKPKLVRASVAKVVAQGDEDDEACAPAVAKRSRHHRRSAAKACAAPVQVAKAEVASDSCGKVKKSHRRACELKAGKVEEKVQVAKAEIAGDGCASVKKSRRKACELKTVKAEARIQIAKAEIAEGPCAKVKKSKLKACEAKAEIQVATAQPKTVDTKGAKAGKLAKAKVEAVENGAYAIQVGSFGDRKLAHAQMEKVSGRFSRLIASAAGEVSHAAGNYRVQFKGFSSAATAKAACQKLSAKGERCMVMAST